MTRLPWWLRNLPYAYTSHARVSACATSSGVQGSTMRQSLEYLRATRSRTLRRLPDSSMGLVQHSGQTRRSAPHIRDIRRGQRNEGPCGRRNSSTTNQHPLCAYVV